MEAEVASLSVVVPVYNNAGSLDELVARLRMVLEDIAPFEIILVDDGSRDDSWLVADALAGADQRVVAMRLSRNFGQHRALTAGLHRADGDVVIFMDADLEDRPEQIPVLLAEFADTEIDVVYTKWETPGLKPSPTSRVFNWTYARMSGVEMPANLGAFRAFRRNVADALRSYGEQGLVYSTAMPQMGFTSTFVTVERSEVEGRQSSYTLRKRLNLASQILVSYSDLPHRVITGMGLGMAMLSGIYLLFILVQFSFGQALPDGLTLLLSVTVLLSGVLLLTVGVLFAYTFRIYQEVLGRPRYHIGRVSGIGLSRQQSTRTVEAITRHSQPPVRQGAEVLEPKVRHRGTSRGVGAESTG